MANEEGDPMVRFTRETMQHEVEHLEEGESSSTSATNLVIDTIKSNAFETDQAEAQSTTLVLPSSEAGRGSLMSEDNAYNNGGQQAGLGVGSSYWGINGYQFAATNMGSEHFPLAVAATTPTAIHLSNAQEGMGGGNNQYPSEFLQTPSSEQWYPLNKIDVQQQPSSNPFRSEEIQFQGLLNQGPSNGTFYSNGLSTIQFPQTRLNLQDGLPSPSNLHLSRNWISEGNGLSNATTPPTSRSPQNRNAVYDPTYESMGLPVDPHLRMFLARRDPTDQRCEWDVEAPRHLSSATGIRNTLISFEVVVVIV
ncbi:hypothetical protein SDJN03_15504, partial [Cucurbita argyrosperma subsp. sororia]